MKKAISLLTQVLFTLTILYPVGVIATACFGYRFELISISFFALVIAVLSVSIVVFDLVSKNTPDRKLIQILLAFLSPLSLINAVFYILEYPHISVIASVILSALSCCYLSVKHGKPLSLKIVALLLSALMIIPIGFLSFIALLFGNIRQDTVVQTLESPNGAYYAQVIDSDQGALGGDTLVNVYERSEINVILFRIKKKPQLIYFGNWGAFKNMNIYWKNEGCLVINSVEYEIG